MTKRWIISAMLLASVALFTACPKQVTVNQLNGDPGRYRDKEVLIIGTVTNSFGGSIPFIRKGGSVSGGAYELTDDTGKIWVVSDRPAPSKGSKVGAIGIYQGGITIAGKTYANAIRETDRKVK